MKHLVVACGIMKNELLQVQQDGDSFVFLEQCLHNTPEKLKAAVQEEINKAEGWDGDTIILGYGLCGNGLVGLKSHRHNMAIPRVHDCISLLLGSRSRYAEEHKKEPGTYYLTTGWIEEKDSPLWNYEKYSQRHGKEWAEMAIREEFKAYTRIAFVHTGINVSESHRNHAIENARFLRLKYEELQGSLTFFDQILHGPWNGDFVVLKPGEEATQEPFLDS